MAFALLAAAAMMMADTATPGDKIDAKREAQSYFGQRNPHTLHNRSNIDQVLGRPYQTSEWIDQRKTGNIFTRSGVEVLPATEEQSGVHAYPEQHKQDLQAVFNDIYQEDLPLQGYSAGAKYNWHIDARARSRPHMSEGVGYIDIPHSSCTDHGIGDWPIHQLEGQPAIFGYRPGTAPRELYRGGPRSLNDRTFHYSVTHGDQRAHVDDDMDH